MLYLQAKDHSKLQRLQKKNQGQNALCKFLDASNKDKYWWPFLYSWFQHSRSLPELVSGLYLCDFINSDQLYFSRLKRLSTNSCLSNIKRSSIFSPTPIYFTGILNWLAIANTTPPFAVPSSFVIAMEVTSVVAIKCLACSKAFWPVEPS